MSKFKFVSLLILLVMSFTVINAQESDVKPVITLQRTPCFGTCPVYTISIFADGTVVYNGENHVTVTGEQTSQIDPATVELMVKAFEDAGYFDWKEAYDMMNVTDLPGVITSVTRDGETHQINRYTGDYTAPLALPFLEQWIDIMTTSNLWTGAQTDPGSISNGTDTAVLTMQRLACFGGCPVDNVAIFADGTVVYTGIANVDAMGVHVYQTDALTVESIAFRAQALGYFDWQAAYDHQVMTDQATVITSVRWEDQFQQITRYDGDPNAPVGLVWVEDLITDLVASLAAE